MIEIKDKKRFAVFLFLVVCFVLSGIYLIKKIVDYGSNKETKEVLEEDPVYQEGVGKLSEGNFEEASKILEDSLDDDSGNPQKMKMLAVSYYNQQNYEEAEKIFEELLKEDEENSYIHYNSLANIYRDQQDYEKAVEYYEKSIEANVEYETAYVNLIVLYQVEIKDSDEAQEIVMRGLENIPDSDILKSKQK